MIDIESTVIRWYNIRFVNHGPREAPIAKIIGKPYLVVNRGSDKYQLAMQKLYLEWIYQNL